MFFIIFFTGDLVKLPKIATKNIILLVIYIHIANYCHCACFIQLMCRLVLSQRQYLIVYLCKSTIFNQVIMHLYSSINIINFGHFLLKNKQRFNEMFMLKTRYNNMLQQFLKVNNCFKLM